MATREQLIQALVAADRAGNAEDAQALAAALKAMPVEASAGAAPSGPAAAPARPMVQTLFGAMPRVLPEQLRREIETDPTMQKIADIATGAMGPTGSIKGVFAGPTSPMAEAARKAVSRGLKVPPGEAAPGMLASALQTLGGGKSAYEAATSVKNQEFWNMAAKRELGVPENVQLTNDVLQTARNKLGGAYEAVKQEIGTALPLNPRFLKRVNAMRADYARAAQEAPETFKSRKAADAVLEEWLGKKYVSPDTALATIKQLRADATDNLRVWNDPAKQALGKVQRKLADAFDSLIEDTLKGMGKGEVAAGYKSARQTIAKSYDIQAALNSATGNVDAMTLGRLLKKGKPLSGELKEVAEFARQFPKAARMAEMVGGAPGIAPWDARFGLAKAGITGDPRWLAEMVVPPAVRTAVLSQPVQRAMVGLPAGPATSETLAQLYRALFAASAQGMKPPGDQ